MTTVLSFVSQSSGKKYRVLGLDKSQDPPLLTLQGEVAKFTQPFDKELFKRCGYELVKEEVPDKEDADDQA
jgi:hypothetical protein